MVVSMRKLQNLRQVEGIRFQQQSTIRPVRPTFELLRGQLDFFSKIENTNFDKIVAHGGGGQVYMHSTRPPERPNGGNPRRTGSTSDRKTPLAPPSTFTCAPASHLENCALDSSKIYTSLGPYYTIIGHEAHIDSPQCRKNVTDACWAAIPVADTW